MKQVRVRVRGRVQGVGFRAFTCREARRLGVRGWVRNCPDGSVEILAQGDEGTLRTFLAIVSQGPPYARVTHVETREESPGERLVGFSLSW